MPKKQPGSASLRTPAYYLRTGMSDDKLKAIGFITLLWNRVEWALQELIWKIAGWKPEIGSLVTIDLGNVGRVQLARNLMKAHALHERLADEIDLVLRIFELNRNLRNGLVHGLPVYDDAKKLNGRIASFDARKETGTLRAKHTEVTSDYLEQMRDDMVFCQEAISDASRKAINLRRYQSDSDIAARGTLEDFVFDYRSPPIGKDDLQSRLDLLTSRASKRVQRAAVPQFEIYAKQG